jgi:hypothetical protein
VKAGRVGLGVAVAVALAFALAAALLTLALRPHRTTGSAPGPVPGSASAPAPGGCGDGRHPCGFPDAATTGVPAGVVLRSVPGQISSGPGWHFDPRGWVQVDGNGAVLSGLYIPYSVSVAASHVTIKDARIVVSGQRAGVGLQHAHDVTIKDSDIHSPEAGAARLMVGVKDIYGDSTGTRVLRDNIWHTATGVQMEAGLIEDSYIHDPGFRQGDHVNGVTSNGGKTALLTVRHNTILIDRRQTDAIGLFEDFGVQANRVIEDNLLAGGGYTIYGGQNPGGPAAHNIVITGNRFIRIYYPHGGYYGHIVRFDPRGNGNVWYGNAWASNTRYETAIAIAGPWR